MAAMTTITPPPTVKAPAAAFTGDVWFDQIHRSAPAEETTWGEPVTDEEYRNADTS